MEAVNVILSPLITEKSMSQAATGRYSFRVAKSATKRDIRRAIEEKFKVNILNISTINIKGRKVNVRTKTRNVEIAKSPFKKALVTVKAGQKISIFDSGAQGK